MHKEHVLKIRDIKQPNTLFSLPTLWYLQGSELHSRSSMLSPLQSLPPCAGGGFVQVLTRS